MMDKRKYIIRLDDASERMDIQKWDRMEKILDGYDMKPVVGVIPKCEDPQMSQYPVDDKFWNKVRDWENKGWDIAMHGYRHLYDSENGGVNPINRQSEFAGHGIVVQRNRIKKGIEIFRNHRVKPRIFFAPSHTFDENTIEALRRETDIRIISDTIAWDVYYENGFIYIPQQSGYARNLPFRTCTFCYHPNSMDDSEFRRLEIFLNRNAALFTTVDQVIKKRKKTIVDSVLRKTYFEFRKLNR